METRTNIVLDDALVERAMAKAGVSTKKAAIEAALRAFVREPDWALILAMEGSRAVADDYDPAGLFAAAPMAVMEPDAAYQSRRCPASTILSCRIDSPDLLPGATSLPHVTCYPPDGLAGAEQRDKASEHGNTQGG